VLTAQGRAHLTTTGRVYRLDYLVRIERKLAKLEVIRSFSRNQSLAG